MSAVGLGRVKPSRLTQAPDDRADALALTFACPVFKTDWAEERCYQELVRTLKRRIVDAASPAHLRLRQSLIAKD